MASVPFEFPPPAQEGLVALHIEEGPTETGPFVEIEVVTAVGTYPDYISSYTTEVAVSATDWFRVRWEDDGGALSEYSPPVQGGVFTLPGEITDRVLQRDGSLSRAVVTQEAEAAIESYYGIDPYDDSLVAPMPNYRILRGLTNLVLANSMLLTLIQSAASTETATIGLITLKEGSSSGSSLKLREIETLIDLANRALGLTYSIVMQMEEIQGRTTILELMEP